MILAGLKPDVISEICSRALSFWVYQVSLIYREQLYLIVNQSVITGSGIHYREIIVLNLTRQLVFKLKSKNSKTL